MNKIDIENYYDDAEKQYTKLSRRYINSWSFIVALYACVLLIIPVSDMLHGKMDASEWITLFKLA